MFRDRRRPLPELPTPSPPPVSELAVSPEARARAAAEAARAAELAESLAQHREALAATARAAGWFPGDALHGVPDPRRDYFNAPRRPRSWRDPINQFIEAITGRW